MVLCCLRCALKPSASATSAISKLYQHFRGHGSPYGLQDTLSTLRPFCSLQASLRLRHGRKTRYGWVASPYPTGTFTLLETPSLSWRDNARLQAPSIAGARHERRLLTVACKPSVRWRLAGLGPWMPLPQCLAGAVHADEEAPTLAVARR